MQNESETLLYKYFKIDYSTPLFVFFSIISFGAYNFFWFIRLLELFDRKDIKSAIFTVFAILVLPEWVDIIDAFVNLSDKNYNKLIFLSAFAIPAISIKYLDAFGELLEKNGASIKLSKVWAWIFPIFYQYYILRNTHVKQEAKADAPRKKIKTKHQSKPAQSEAETASQEVPTEQNKADATQQKTMPGKNEAAPQPAQPRQNDANREEIKRKLIKLNSLYQEGKITSEQYEDYKNRLRELLKK